MGNAYNNGEGVAKDQQEAVRWFRMAAEQGDAEAQYNLGLSYANGEGVAKDQGDAWAQYNLGNAYNNGEGVAKDQQEAVRWFRMAAEQRHASAQYNLG